MKLTLRRYSFLLTLQFSFLIADLFFNTFAHGLLSDKLELTILLFVLQDVLIICEYLFFTFAVHSTCVYEVGATCVILRNCKLFFCTIFLYFILSSSKHFCIVYNIFWATNSNWAGATMALSIVQRLMSVLYYYSYKRTALCLSDPRYNEQNIDWIVAQLGEN